MKNNKREFEKFRDSEFRTNFWQDFNQIVRNINFTSLGAVVDYNKIKKELHTKKNLMCNSLYIV